MRPVKRLLLLVSLCGCAAAPDVQRPPESPRLLIVAPEAFHAALRDYRDWRAADMPTALLSLELILKAEDGADEAEKVKRALYRFWRRGGLRYVLLVGDADVFPVRFMMLDRVTKPAFDVAFYPSDLYYADLAKPDGTFEDWNAAKEGVHAGYFGEVHGEHHKSPPVNFDAIDYRPEIGVGRWPVSTAGEVAALAAKTRAYEEGLDERERLLGLVVTGGWVDARAAFDAAARAAGWPEPSDEIFRSPEEFLQRKSTEKLYYTDDGKQPDPSRIAALANGEALVVAHAGHGSEGGWHGVLGIDALRQNTDPRRATVLLSAGCGTAVMATQAPYEGYTDVLGAEHPGTGAGEVFSCEPPPPACFQPRHNPTSFGEQSLRLPGGAVAYFGCDTGSQPCGLTLVGAFVEGLASPEARLGDLWRGAVAAYWDRERLADIVPTDDWYPASIFFQGMKFVLFGDPSLRLSPR